MKIRTLLIFFIISISSNLSAQKAQIDPYLRAANQAYGTSKASNGRTLKSQDAMALRQSMRAIGIEQPKDQEELRADVTQKLEI